jgi:hypothetical protein
VVFTPWARQGEQTHWVAQAVVVRQTLLGPQVLQIPARVVVVTEVNYLELAAVVVVRVAILRLSFQILAQLILIL